MSVYQLNETPDLRLGVGLAVGRDHSFGADDVIRVPRNPSIAQESHHQRRENETQRPDSSCLASGEPEHEVKLNCGNKNPYSEFLVTARMTPSKGSYSAPSRSN